MLIDAPVCGVSLYVGAPRMREDAPRMDASGRNQLCEKCGCQLAKVKHHRAHGPGRACTPRCKPSKHRSADNASSSMTVAPSPAKKRCIRAQSDPGQPPVLMPTRTRPHRVSAHEPPSVPRYKKPSAAELSAQLDATHARRMALLEEEAKIVLAVEGSP